MLTVPSSVQIEHGSRQEDRYHAKRTNTAGSYEPAVSPHAVLLTLVAHLGSSVPLRRPMDRDRHPITPPGRVGMSDAAHGDRSTVLWLQGEHDTSTVPRLSEAMASAIARDDGDVVVDLSGVDFMDASTVGVVLRARMVLDARSRAMTLRSPSTRARRILDVLGLAGSSSPGP